MFGKKKQKQETLVRMRNLAQLDEGFFAHMKDGKDMFDATAREIRNTYQQLGAGITQIQENIKEASQMAADNGEKEQELTGQLAAELLLGESSALYEDLYTRGLIDADFSSGFTRVPGAAFLQAGGAGCDPEAVLEAILQAPKTSFSPERFARLKKSVRGRLLRELDGFESTCYRICEAIFAGGDCFCEFDLLDSITLSDTEALLTQTVTPECAALSVAAPEEA